MSSNSNKFHVCIETQLNTVDADQWNAMNKKNHPFLNHAFLNGLETCDCVCHETGWLGQHILIYQDDSKTKLIAALPCYLKEHSYGEYIFDWSWADAYRRSGLAYYPKLSCATPFTPATAPKWLIHPDYDEKVLINILIKTLKQHALDCRVSSIHVLFTNTEANQYFSKHDFICRSSSQFHWHNQCASVEDSFDKSTPFSNFDDYLQTMSSRKRKNIKRERKRVAEQGVHFKWYTDDNLNEHITEQIFAFYLSTTYRYGAQQYLSKAFFQHFVKSIPQMTHILIAYIDDSPVAGGLFFSSESTLYGRYWGANADIKDLHFETCYYQPIEYAIQQGFSHFEAGAQGEHKLSRGLLPVTTYSQHWLADERFRVAVADFTRTEAEHIQRYNTALTDHGPFKTIDAEKPIEI